MSVHRKPGRATGLRKAAAFYDLDGTLAPLNLLHSTAFVLANLGEWSGRIGYLLGLAARLPHLYLAERQDRRGLNVAMFEVFKGVSRDRLEELGEEYCDRLLIPRLYPRGLAMIEANRAVGLEPVL